VTAANKRQLQPVPEQTLALAWLLACLDRAVECMDYLGYGCDARVVEAHRREMAGGREFPGDVLISASEATFARQERLDADRKRREAS
jgi:hypothetical protein